MKKKNLPKTKQHSDALITFKSIDRENRRITGVVASDGLIDRHGESLNPNGWKINGHVPILWGHKYDDLPIGKSTQEKIENDQLVVDLRLSKKYDKAGTIFDLIEENIIDKVSVGFIPLKYDDSGDYTYAEMELLEVSFVTIPANPRAGLKKKDIEDKIKSVEDGLNKMLAELNKEKADEPEENEDTDPQEGEEKAENEAKEQADSPQEPEEKPEVEEKTVSDDDKSEPPEKEPENEEKSVTLTKDELQSMLKEAAKEAVKELKEKPEDNNELEEKTLLEQLVEMRDALRSQYTSTAKSLEQINKYLKTERK